MELTVFHRRPRSAARHARHALGPLLLCLAVLLWLLQDYQSHRSHLREVLRSQATSVAATLDVTLTFLATGQRRPREALLDCLRQILVSSGVSGIALSGGGRVLLQAGEGIHPQHLPGDLGEVWTGDFLVVGQRVRSPAVSEALGAELLRSGEHGGRDDEGAAGDAGDARRGDPAGPRRLILAVAVTTLPLEGELATLRQHAHALGGFAVLLSAALFFWLVARSRARDLGTALLIADERLHLMRDRAQAAAGLAHETKNPLGAIRGLAQLFADGAVAPGEVREQASRIAEEVDRTVARINEFLNYARPREPRPRVVALEPLFEDVREFVQAGGPAACTIDARGISIKADPDLLRQVLFNLLINAVEAVKQKFGDRDGGVVELRAACSRESRCAIAVRDNGCGIAAEDLPRLFTPYFSRRPGGTGLGLAIVKDIIEAHGWTIGVTSRPGEGSEFTIAGLEMG